MNNIIRLGLVICGFMLAIFASSNSVEAKKLNDLNCVGGSGTCGITPSGTILYGWCECN